MTSLRNGLIDHRFEITDNDAFHSVCSKGFKGAVKTAVRKYVAEYDSFTKDPIDFSFVYEYTSLFGFSQGFAITDYCIYGDEGSTFMLNISDLSRVKYDDDDNEIVFVPKKGLSYYIKVSPKKKDMAQELIDVINDYL